MKNEFKEQGPFFLHGPRLKDDGSALKGAVRKALAEHQRLLKGAVQRTKALGGRYANKLAGKRITELEDGTVITTWVNPFGLVPILMSNVITPASLSTVEIVEESLGYWLCWPSSDDAIYGWGNPYENPPGILINPPLGTVQTAYSDTKRIARAFDTQDVVTHGVNKIAGWRDWRHDATALVVSWDSAHIYSGGLTLISQANIDAACVRWVSGTSYLIWFVQKPYTLYAQECRVVDDAVTEVTGSITTAAVSGLPWRHLSWWSEFSQDGTSFVVNAGETVVTNDSYSGTVPWPFSVLPVNALPSETQKPPNTTWVNSDNFEGTQTFLIKSQFVSNVITHVWLRIDILQKLDSVRYLEKVIEAGPYCFPFVCYWDLCGQRVYTVPSRPWHISSTNFFEQYIIKPTVLISATEIYNENVVDFDTETWEWALDASYEGFDASGEPNFPSASFGPFPGWCPISIVVSKDKKDIFSRCISRQTIDARAGCLTMIDIGYSTEWNPRDDKWLRVETRRAPGGADASAEIAGDYGYIDWPSNLVTVDEAKLLEYLTTSAILFCAAEGHEVVVEGTKVGMVAVNLTSQRAVQCAWGRDEATLETNFVNLLEGADIDALLSISNEPNPRIIINSEGRYMGLVKQVK